jgi:cytochrome P450
MPTEKGNSLLFGIAPEMIKEDLNQVQFYRRLIEKHGKLFRMKVAPGRYVVVVSDVDYIQFVRQNEGEHPVRGDFFRPLKIIIEAESELKYPPTALATGDGPEWKKLRSDLNPILSTRRLGKQVERLDGVSQTLLEMLQESVDRDGYSKNVMDFLPYWSLESMLTFMFPQNLDIQRSKDQRAVDIYSGVSAVLNTVQLQHYPDWMLKYLPLEGMKKGREGNRKYKAAAMDYINEVKSKGISTSEDPAEGTMYEQLEAKGMPSEEIIIILADFLAGGADTTVQIIAGTIHQLAKYPEVQKKAHDEVVSVAGKDGVITVETMRKLPYIKAIQKEGGRFASLTGPVSTRILNEEVEIGGYRIPEKTLIICCNAELKKDPTIFPNPDEFRPERWLRDGQINKDLKVQQIAASIFGFGPRSCIGRRAAEFKMWTFLAKMMQKTEIKLHPDSVDLQAIGPAFMRVDRPLRLKFTPV